MKPPFLPLRILLELLAAASLVEAALLWLVPALLPGWSGAGGNVMVHLVTLTFVAAPLVLWRRAAMARRAAKSSSRPAGVDVKNTIFPARNVALISALALVLLALTILAAMNEYTRGHTNEVRFREFRGEALLLDERLTMSARLAAATGDPRWEDRYRQAEKDLDAVLKSCDEFMARLLGKDAEGARAAVLATSMYNDRLIELENRCFDLVRGGNLAAAMAVMTSSEYAQLKEQYAQATAQADAAIDRMVSAATLNSHRHAIAIAWFGLMCAVAMSGGMLWSLGTARARAMELANSMTRHLQASEAEARGALAILAAYRSALEQQVLIDITDLSGKITDVNESFCRISGFRREELIGADHRIVNSGHHPRSFWNQMWDTILRGGIWRAEVCNKAKNGTLYWVDTTVGPIRDAAGKVSGYIAMRVDITERKQGDETLRRVHQVQEEMSRVAKVGGWDLDVATGKMTWTGGIYRICELPEASTPTLERMLSFFPPESREVVSRKIERATNQDEPFDDTLPFTTATGCKLWVHGRGNAERRADGTMRLYGALQDVTDAQLKNVELTEALDAAKAANQAKSAFLAMMSHEIRTPLNGIVGMTNVLLDAGLTPGQKDYAETIRHCADSLLSLINDILDFSKIESGKLELESQPFDLYDCIESALELVAPAAAQKGLDLLYRVGDGTPSAFFGDVTRIRQVLVNLASNAVKFTERGEVVIAAEATPLGNASQELHLSVKDTGVGIPDDRKDRLFKSFSQVDSSTTRKYGGTGLGLAISKRLCELMGGTISVESELGKGSTFHCTLVCRQAPSVARVYLQGAQPELKEKRVLIVDDNATNRWILKLQVEKWGMAPFLAESGAAALAVIDSGQALDVAVIDMHMPDMDGLMLAAAIRKVVPATALPIVLLTSLGDGELAGPGVDTDARAKLQAFLMKPVKPGQLFETLVRTLEAKAGRKKAPRLEPEAPKRTPLHAMRILLAEDNPVNQKVGLLLLEKLGYRADVAASGLEVLEALHRQQYDAILMDVQMPEMDGLEASRHIKAEWKEEERPRIIAMTANAMQGDREKCLEAGMDDYICKPVRMEELREALARCHAAVQPVA